MDVTSACGMVRLLSSASLRSEEHCPCALYANAFPHLDAALTIAFLLCFLLFTFSNIQLSHRVPTHPINWVVRKHLLIKCAPK